MIYKVSVVIPCHNSELTLKNSIESIIHQTLGFENIELILYDNASTDSTRRIMQDYAEKFENIVPHYSDIDSGFPGTGRNKGIEVASSEYIMFMDSDDEYDSQMCEKLYNVMINEKVDLACSDTLRIDEIGEIKKNLFNTSKLDENGYALITDDDIIQFPDIAVWNKIFKKDIIHQNNLYFLENTYADDFAFTLSYYTKSKKMIYLKDYFGYIWNIHGDSLSHDVKRKDITDLIIGYSYVYKVLKKENKEKLMNNVIKGHISFLLTQCTYLHLNENEFKEVLNEILIFEKEINFSTKLDEMGLNKINQLILNKKFKSAILGLKLIDNLRKNNALRKINRLFTSN